MLGEISEAEDGNILYRQIRNNFNNNMKNSNISLLRDFTTYSKSLPVRYYKGDFITNNIHQYIPLFKLNYYVRPEDLETMARAIMKKGTSREAVRYISAPTGSGKTASVLPAFLRSTSMKGGGTHYMYIAFRNNNSRNFISSPSIPSSDEDIAERQGAAFMVECVRTLLERPDDIPSYRIDIKNSPQLDVEDCSELLNNYLSKKLGGNFSIWFHLDEHGKMCDRSPDSAGDGAAFSRGAMAALACVTGAKVIATYTDRPELPVDKSIGVCRIPIALPPIDINQVWEIVPELAFNTSHFSCEQSRMLATLKFRLGFKLRENDYISVLHRRHTSIEAEDFLLAFAKAKEEIKGNATDALIKCNECCEYSSGFEEISDNLASRLLLGIMDNNVAKTKRLTEVVSLLEGYITTSVTRLLNIFDPKVNVYDTGKGLFVGQLLTPDLLSSTPLETAYFWTLSCRSALEKSLVFLTGKSYRIDCKRLIPGRLFPATDSSVYNLELLRKNTMYYADENRMGQSKHPLADLFFVSDDNELVLVDVYGGLIEEEVNDKKMKLVKWIKNEQPNMPKKVLRGVEQLTIPKYTLHGVVLAPHTNVQSGENEGVLIVAGPDAVKLLGGLKQIDQWLE